MRSPLLWLMISQVKTIHKNTAKERRNNCYSAKNKTYCATSINIRRYFSMLTTARRRKTYKIMMRMTSLALEQCGKRTFICEWNATVFWLSSWRGIFVFFFCFFVVTIETADARTKNEERETKNERKNYGLFQKIRHFECFIVMNISSLIFDCFA